MPDSGSAKSSSSVSESSASSSGPECALCGDWFYTLDSTVHFAKPTLTNDYGSSIFRAANDAFNAWDGVATTRTPGFPYWKKILAFSDGGNNYTLEVRIYCHRADTGLIRVFIPGMTGFSHVFGTNHPTGATRTSMTYVQWNDGHEVTYGSWTTTITTGDCP